MEEHLKLLGFIVQDKVTKFEGVIVSISFDLFGCIQAVVQPKIKDGNTPECRWFDLKRLKPLSKCPVMEIPSFIIVPGGNELPAFPSLPHKSY